MGGAEVIFGEEGDHKLLGVFTLGALEFVLDPVKYYAKMGISDTDGLVQRARNVFGRSDSCQQRTRRKVN